MSCGCKNSHHAYSYYDAATTEIWSKNTEVVATKPNHRDVMCFDNKKLHFPALNHVLFGLLKNFQITRDLTCSSHPSFSCIKSRVI